MTFKNPKTTMICMKRKIVFFRFQRRGILEAVEAKIMQDLQMSTLLLTIQSHLWQPFLFSTLFVIDRKPETITVKRIV